ncbi:MAG: capsule biosynthesis protein [Rhodoblastus sp.]|nr:capsule biosynthesis protein [Rhodoblastus sp.]
MNLAYVNAAERGKRLAMDVARARRFRLSRGALFVAMIVIPTTLAIVYYSVIASNQYVSEAQYVVRSVSSRRVSGLEMLFQSFGIAPTVDNANAVQGYIQSRDAVQALESQLPLREMFGRKDVDILARFPRFWRSSSFEELYRYYIDRVSVIQDQDKGITKLNVVAFSAEDAQRLCQAVLVLAERFANRMNARAESDTVKLASDEVAEAERRVLGAQRNLTEFRLRVGLIDPNKDAGSVLSTITSLSTELAQVIAQLKQIETSSTNNPAIAAMKSKANALRASISAQRDKLSGGDVALASKIADYEQLSLALGIANAALEGANVALQVARQEARRQAIYIEEVVRPNLADESTEPRRFRMIVTVFVFSFALASITWLMLAGVGEHEIE